MAEYDKLTIKIVANTAVAINNIERLSSRLEELDKQAARMDLGRLKDVQAVLEDIAKIDFSKVSSSLYDITKTFEKLSSVSSKTRATMEKSLALEKLEETSSESVEKTAEQIGEVSKGFELSGKAATDFYEKIQQYNELSSLSFGSSISGLRDYAEELKQVKEKVEGIAHTFIELETTGSKLSVSLAQTNAADSSFEAIGEAMERINLNGTQMESVLATIGQETNKFSDWQIKQVEKAMKRLGYSAKQIKLTLSKLHTQGNKTMNGLGKSLQGLAKKFKSLAIYRVMRQALMKIQQEFTAGIQNLAQSDTAFNDAMSRLSNSFTYLANSVVAAIAPVLEMLTPIIETLADGLAEIPNMMGSLFSSAAGRDTFTEATKGAEDYAESLKKVKNATLGIDELNVIGQDTQESNFKEIEITPSESGFESAFKELSDALKPVMDAIGKIVEALSPLFTTIGPVLQSLEPVFNAIADLLTALSPIIKIIATLITNLINKVAGKIGNAIASVIEAIATVVELIAVIFDALEPILNIIIDVIGTVINIISTVIKTVADLISTALKPVISILRAIFTAFKPIFEVFEKLFSKINAILEKLFSKIGEALVDVLKPIGYVLEIVGALLEKIAPLLAILADILGAVFGMTDDTRLRVIAGILSLGTSEGLHAMWQQSGTAEVSTPDTEIVQNSYNSVVPYESADNTTNVNVYVDSEQIATRVEQALRGRGTSTFSKRSLTYVK